MTQDPSLTKSLARARVLAASLPFNSRKDLTAVALIGTGAMVLATNADSPCKTFADVVAASQWGQGRRLRQHRLGEPGTPGHHAAGPRRQSRLGAGALPWRCRSGFAGFDAPAGWAVLAPARTPPDIVQRMNDEIGKALKLPDVARTLALQGLVIRTGTPAAAQAFIEHQIETWAKEVKDNAINAD